MKNVVRAVRAVSVFCNSSPGSLMHSMCDGMHCECPCHKTTR